MYRSDVSNPNFFAKLVKIVKNRKKSRMSKDDSKYKSLRVSPKQYITVM